MWQVSNLEVGAALGTKNVTWCPLESFESARSRSVRVGFSTLGTILSACAQALPWHAAGGRPRTVAAPASASASVCQACWSAQQSLSLKHVQGPRCHRKRGSLPRSLALEHAERGCPGPQTPAAQSAQGKCCWLATWVGILGCSHACGTYQLHILHTLYALRCKAGYRVLTRSGACLNPEAKKTSMYL